MEKELNLVEILKDCPKGTKLYSPILGVVEFRYIVKESIEGSIVILASDSNKHSFTKTGKLLSYDTYDGECMLFPSKDQRDWSKFKIEPELVDGEVYYAKTEYVEWIFIYRKNFSYKTMHYVAILNNYLMEFNNICTTHNEDIKAIRRATEEEKRLFFEKLEKNHLKWDADKKELMRIESKFDISILQPFDKVLVRGGNDRAWKCDFFSSISTNYCKFCCVGYYYPQCIPYNEETKHIVGTTEMPPEKYITWEE